MGLLPLIAAGAEVGLKLVVELAISPVVDAFVEVFEGSGVFELSCVVDVCCLSSLPLVDVGVIVVETSCVVVSCLLTTLNLAPSA